MSKLKIHKHEEGLILILLIAAIIVLAWLFMPFLPALFISMLISISSYNLYEKLIKKLPKKISAILMTIVFGVILIIPISYIIFFITIKSSVMINALQENFQLKEIEIVINQIINMIPGEYQKKFITEETLQNSINIILNESKNFLLIVLKAIASISSQIFIFSILAIFSLYYFYVDGTYLLNKIKQVSPMDNNINNILIKQFSSLSITLMGSVFIVAILQGITFFIVASFVNLPAIFLGIAIALAGFIPVLGGMLVWLPTTIYLFVIGETIAAFIILFFGAIIIGIVIDNIVRPIIIKKLASAMNHKIAINNTFITVLSIIAGVIKFGILGLFIGPIIAAMAITMIDIYKIKYR